MSWVDIAPGPQLRTRRFAAPLPPHSCYKLRGRICYKTSLLSNGARELKKAWIVTTWVVDSRLNQVPVCDKWRCISWVEVAPGPQRRTRRFAAPLPPHSGTESPPQVDAGTGRTAARFALAYTRSPTRWAAATPRSECGRPASTPGPTRGSEFVMRRHRIVTREGASTTNPRVRGGTLRLSSQPPSGRISRPGRGGRTAADGVRGDALLQARTPYGTHPPPDGSSRRWSRRPRSRAVAVRRDSSTVVTRRRPVHRMLAGVLSSNDDDAPRGPSGEEGFDDQTGDAGEHQAQHPFQELELAANIGELRAQLRGVTLMGQRRASERSRTQSEGRAPPVPRIAPSHDLGHKSDSSIPASFMTCFCRPRLSDASPCTGTEIRTSESLLA